MSAFGADSKQVETHHRKSLRCKGLWPSPWTCCSVLKTACSGKVTFKPLWGSAHTVVLYGGFVHSQSYRETSPPPGLCQGQTACIAMATLPPCMVSVEAVCPTVSVSRAQSVAPIISVSRTYPVTQSSLYHLPGPSLFFLKEYMF